MMATRRGHEEGLHPHVDQAGHGPGGVVRVQGAEDQVPGEGRLDGHIGRLRVADLPDEDDVGRLPEHGPQDAGEGELDGPFAWHWLMPERWYSTGPRP